MDPVVFRPRLSRAIALVVTVLAAGAVVTTALADPGTALRQGPLYALGAVLVWAVLGRPAVVVSDAGVELRNVLRTVALPWPAIVRVDTQYALTLHTAYGPFTAWAAPAPGGTQTLGTTPSDSRHLPRTTFHQGTVRPGDLIGTASGDAAAYIRRRWDELHDAGHLDEPVLERDRPLVRWHVVPALGVAALAVVAVALSRLP